MGSIFIYILFAGSVTAGLLRPFIGLLGFYAFVFLQPEWNWRWSIPDDFGFQSYIAVATMLGMVANGLRGNSLYGWLGISGAGLVGFLGIAYVSAGQSVAPILSERFMHTILRVIVMTVVTIRLVDSPQRGVALMWVILLGSGYNAFRINQEYFQLGYCYYIDRPWGLKGDSNVYCVFTLPAVSAAISLYTFARKWPIRIAAAVLLLLLVHQIFLMESRGTMLGLIMIGLFYLWLMPKNTHTMSSTAVAILVLAIIAGPPVVKEFSSTFNKAVERDDSAASRFILWRAGIEITRDNPALGVGPYAVQAVIPRYASEYANVQYKAPHNLFLEISAGCGLFALAFYLLFFILSWYKSLRIYKLKKGELSDDANAGMFALAITLPGYFLASMFSSGALVESMYVLTALGAGVTWSVYSTSQSNSDALVDESQVDDPDRAP